MALSDQLAKLAARAKEAKLDRRRHLRLIGAFALAPLGGCERAPSRTPPLPGSYVRIAKLSPDATVPLKVGEKVSLQIEIDYALTKADTGAVMVVVQTADNKSLGQKAQAIAKGVGKATLAVDFVVPQTSAVKVFAPLSEEGQTSTSTVALRTYKVIGEK